MHRLTRLLLFVVILATLPPALAAQQPDIATTPADSALVGCIAAHEAKHPRAAATAARAETLWRAEVGRLGSGAPARVGLARVLVQCLLPTSGMSEQAALFEEAVGVLHQAIALDPKYWQARFTLGLVLARAPTFLGQTANAIAALELAVAPGAMPPNRPGFADALAALGDLYVTVGRIADAATVRSRGLALFPTDPRFGGMPKDSPAEPARERPAEQLNEISVTVAAAVAEGRRSGRAMSSIDIVTTPGGTADLLQALQTLPGVTGGSESSDLALRGGDPQESPLHLNGARLAYAGKFESLNGGLFGVIDPSVLKSARVLAGAFSARYGDALSGVIEAETMGQPGGNTWRSGINSVGVSGTISRPLGRKTGGWASVRATHTGLMVQMQNRSSDYSSVPSSLEGIASVVRRLDTGELQAVVLVEHDVAAPFVTAGGYRGAYDARGTTASGIVSGRLKQVGPLAALRFNVAMSSRQSELTFGALDRSRELRRIGTRGEADWIVGQSVFMRGGVELARMTEAVEGTVPTSSRFEPGAPTRAFSGEVRRATHLGSFAEAMIAANDWLSITAGVRLDRLPGETTASVDPRLELAAQTGDWLLTLGGGVFHQGRFRQTSDQPGADTRTGVPRRADHVVLGVERRGRITIRADAYVKRYSEWADGAIAFTPTAGQVFGADLFVNVPGRTRSGRVTYSLARGRFSLPDGSSISTAHDVTHSIVAVGSQRFGKDWELATTARMSTGRPFTAITGVSAIDPASSAVGPLFGPPNGGRYPNYARLDARVTRYARVSKGLLVVFAEMLNVTNRGNVAAYGYDAGFTERTAIRTFFGRRTAVFGAEIRF